MHTSRNGKIGVRRITVTGFRVGVIYYRHGESGASIQDAASVNLNLRQDGRPKGGTVYRLRSTAVSFRDDARKRKDNIHIRGRIIKTIASRRGEY
jgi:hypothetical protein